MERKYPVAFVIEPLCCKFTEVMFDINTNTGDMYVSSSITTQSFDPNVANDKWYINAIQGTRGKYSNFTLLYFIVSNQQEETYALRDKLQGIVSNSRLFCQPSVPGDSSLLHGTHNQYALRVTREQLHEKTFF